MYTCVKIKEKDTVATVTKEIKNRKIVEHIGVKINKKKEVKK